MQYLLRLVKQARPYWKHLIAAALSMLAVTGLNLIGPNLISRLVEVVTNLDQYPDARRVILNLALILLISYAGRTLFAFLYRYLAHYAAWRLVADMRVVVYDKLQQLSLRYYHDKQTGQLMSRVTNDTATFEMLIAHAVPDLVTNVLILIGVAIVLFSKNAALAALTLIPIPFLAYAGFVFVKKIQPNFRYAQRALADFNADLQDNLSGIREIQIFNRQEYETTKLRQRSYAHADAILRALKLSGIFHPIVEFFSSLGTVIVVAMGGLMAMAGNLPVEDIVGFVLYLGMFYQPIGALGQVMENLQQALAGAERVFEVLDTEPDVKEKENPIELKDVKGEITFEDVTFYYRPDVYVLKDISFEIKPGQMVAFVGPTGVGKTTIMSLLARFYDPVSGCIKIDGIDIRDVTLRSLRDNISIVLQDVFLFNGTVAENIAYGTEDATMDDIINAAKIACAHDFIMTFPDGYDTYIGERGVNLSGGQKQRLAIARAVLRDTPILILDEATSSVDAETERQIQNAINNLANSRTILIIAHRLSTVKKADNIIVLDEGRIVEQGTHEELMKRGGLYSYLCSMQFNTEDTVKMA
jgi:ATP-binding cassette subfamily B protein